jgi:hypothetical protein
VSRGFTDAKWAAIGVLAFFAVIVTLGTIVDLTSIGDDHDYEPALLEELSKFQSTKQYETVSMQKKRPWAHGFMAFSAVRNINKLNIQSYPYRETLKDNKD